MKKNASYKFKIRELPLSYDTTSKLFTCDKDQVVQILYSYYPYIYEQLCFAHPEIKLLPVKDIDDNSKVSELNSVVAAPPIAQDAKEIMPKPSEAPKVKNGIILSIKKGIKKLIYKITPKKLRKRLNMSEC
jgi:hypothetical protein